MLKIYNIKEKQEFLREVAELTQKEWGSKTNSKEEFEAKVSNLLIKSNQLLVLIRFARKKRNILQMSLYVLHR